MTAGNQGKAYDNAVAALKRNPGDANLKKEVDRTKAALNQSLTASKQKTID
jgi:hypothetical protein